MKFIQIPLFFSLFLGPAMSQAHGPQLNKIKSGNGFQCNGNQSEYVISSQCRGQFDENTGIEVKQINGQFSIKMFNRKEQVQYQYHSATGCRVELRPKKELGEEKVKYTLRNQQGLKKEVLLTMAESNSVKSTNLIRNFCKKR